MAAGSWVGCSLTSPPPPFLGSKQQRQWGAGRGSSLSSPGTTPSGRRWASWQGVFFLCPQSQPVPLQRHFLKSKP